MRHALHIQYRNVALAAFDLSHVRAIDSGSISQRLLRKATFATGVTDRIAKRN